ncbi:PDR/VanB family oxidoreductase [Microbacterium sp. No. 7]|uniref:PDR/VanB family oxidoreductase n=1 Tax=Microbacterium sp. No. 7 TaxID=1714373 RepID=UPI0018D0FC35|nr:PDR/VanB family oxidoreductase [Microbacterium sp. No. 7]
MSQTIKLRVRSAELVAEGVRQLELESMAGLDLPPWQPGAHIEVRLPSGLVRHYSLCGDPADRKVYRIAVLREAAGRGGSIELHDAVAAGDAIEVRTPRNNFELHPAGGYLFLGGGIGVTPLIPMMREADEKGIPWRLVYGGRSRSSMAYVTALQAEHGEQVAVSADDAEGRPDFAALLDALVPGTAVYACGPTPMLDLLAAMAVEREPAVDLHLERFAVDAVDITGEPFEAELTRSGVTIEVGSDETLLGAMLQRGLNAPYSCENGYCGTCEAVVLEGEPDHRDTYLTDDEKADGFTMMICVSRCAGRRIVLDL